MSATNPYPPQRIFQGLRGTRNKTQRSFPKNPSSTTRAYGAPTAVNHPRPMVPGNPNLEMSQISQLSMDSSLRANSQSINLVDVPLGQPSASMGSYNSHSHSSTSSADEDLWRCSHLNEEYPLSGFPNNNGKYIVGARNCLRGFIRNARSTTFRGPIKSSLRAKKKEKTKRTRFAGISDTRSVDDRHATSQGSHNISSSLSSSRSCGSYCTTQSGCRIQVQHPATMTNTSYGQVVSHLGDRSPYHPPRQHRHQRMKGSNRFLQGFGKDLDHSCRGSEHVRVLRSRDSRSKNSSKKQQHSPSIVLLDPIFAKNATPRKKINIPYPPLLLQSQRRHRMHIQQQEEQQIYECGVDTKNATVKSRIETEIGCYDQEEICTPSNDEMENVGAGSISNIKNADTQSFVSQGVEKDEEQTASHGSVPVAGPEVATGPFNACACANGQDGLGNLSSKNTIRSKRTYSATVSIPLNSEEKIQQERHSTANESDNFNAWENEDLTEFKARLQKILCEVETEAKANFQKVAQTVTCVIESRLDQQAKKIQEAMKVELDEKANAIQESTQSNLDRRAEAIQILTRSILVQKQGDAEKAIKNLFDSKTTRLKEIALASVEKVEACTESSLAKLSKFTETWLANSCNAIANRLKPYLFLSAETSATKYRDSGIVIGRVTEVNQSRNKRHSVVASTDSDRLKKTSPTQIEPSSKKDPVGNFPSSIEGEVSLTQSSESRVSRKSNVGKHAAKPLRRSKRTRKSNNLKGFIDIDKNYIPTATVKKSTNDQKQRRDSPLVFRKKKKNDIAHTECILPLTIAKNDKTLCVTSTAGNPESQKKTKECVDKSTLSFNNEPKVESNALNHSYSNRRKRRKTRSPLTMKRSEIQCGSNRGSVPSEVVAFDNFQLSPLEDPNLFTFAKIERHPNGIAFRAKSATKPSLLLGKKIRNTVSRTYTKRGKKVFDVTDNDIFNF